MSDTVWNHWETAEPSQGTNDDDCGGKCLKRIRNGWWWWWSRIYAISVRRSVRQSQSSSPIRSDFMGLGAVVPGKNGDDTLVMVLAGLSELMEVHWNRLPFSNIEPGSRAVAYICDRLSSFAFRIIIFPLTHWWRELGRIATVEDGIVGLDHKLWVFQRRFANWLDYS